MTIKDIRAMLGIGRVEFAEKYGIPYRTLQNWEVGIRKPPEWAVALLERVVREDAKDIK